jgi:hypothetical protein
MSSSNGHASAVLVPVPAQWRVGVMRPETGPQPHDGPSGKVGRGVARLHERGDETKAEDPLVKFARVWSQAYAGNSGVERLTGQ